MEALYAPSRLTVKHHAGANVAVTRPEGVAYNRLSMEYFLKLFLGGLTKGSDYALIAPGYTMVWKEDVNTLKCGFADAFLRRR